MPVKPPAKIAGKDLPWQLTITADQDADPDAWARNVLDITVMGLGTAKAEADVMSIFKVNRNVFDELKKVSPETYDDMMDEFKKAKLKFREEEEQE
jgi:hypothetical protein